MSHDKDGREEERQEKTERLDLDALSRNIYRLPLEDNISCDGKFLGIGKDGIARGHNRANLDRNIAKLRKYGILIPNDESNFQGKTQDEIYNSHLGLVEIIRNKEEKVPDGSQKTPFFPSMNQSDLDEVGKWVEEELKNLTEVDKSKNKRTFKVPGSVFIAGEHSVVWGGQAILLPIPLFMHVAFTFERVKEQHCTLEITSRFPGIGLEFKELKKSRTSKEKFKHCIHRISCTMRKEICEETVDRGQGDSHQIDVNTRIYQLFKSELEKRINLSNGGYVVRINIVSEIPVKCGLGSSGAFSAALSIILNTIVTFDKDKKEEKKLPEEFLNFFNNASKKDIKDLQDGDIFKKVLLDSVKFESGIHLASSGAGPFASLFGHSILPFKYERNKPELPKKKEENDEERIQRFIGNFELEDFAEIDKNVIKNWEEKVGVAVIYSMHGRPTTLDVQQNSRVKERVINGKGLNDWKKLLDKVVEKIWKNLNDKNIDLWDIIRGINAFHELEAAYMKMLRGDDDGVTHRPEGNEFGVEDINYIIEHFQGKGLGAKFTGSGNGGDIIIIGNKEKIIKELIPNHFPTHFINFYEQEKGGNKVNFQFPTG